MHYTYIIAMLSQNLQSLASVVVSIHFFVPGTAHSAMLYVILNTCAKN